MIKTLAYQVGECNLVLSNKLTKPVFQYFHLHFQFNLWIKNNLKVLSSNRIEELQPWLMSYLHQSRKVHPRTSLQRSNSASTYLFKINNRSTRTKCEICSKLTIKTTERRQWRQWCLYCQLLTIVKIVLVFLLLALRFVELGFRQIKRKYTRKYIHTSKCRLGKQRRCLWLIGLHGSFRNIAK